jgi:hypothetical protein
MNKIISENLSTYIQKGKVGGSRKSHSLKPAPNPLVKLGKARAIYVFTYEIGLALTEISLEFGRSAKFITSRDQSG